MSDNNPNFNELELDVLKFWQDSKTFEKSLAKNTGKTPFIFYDGPPFATGAPHYGHMLGSIIKDAVGRYQTMQGKYVRRRWGWDCHGLPIENVVEQKLGISGKKQIEQYGVAKFNEACRSNVLAYVEEWGRMVDRMGRWVEFDDSYKTMDTTYMESVWWGLKQTWDKGLIYEDRKVLLYCSRCETPISNFEVAMDNSYRDVTEESVFAKFKLHPSQRIVDFMTDDNTYALAWTTTPWTLPGNTALNIGSDITYVIVEQNSEHYILAKDRLEVLGDPAVTPYEIKLEASARSLEGLLYEPLYPGVIPDPELRAHKIYSADFVTTTDGTGIVHNAAMYGEDDYKLAKEKNLPRVDMLDHKGHYLDIAPEALRGVFFKNAEKIVLKDLAERNLVYKTEHYTHSYPHCYRCATPLFYNALPAWFINIQKIKSQLLASNESVNWYPDHLKHGRFAKSMEAAPDWNISRNRYWATALPFWKCSNGSCKNVTCIGSIDELREKSSNFLEIYPHYDAENQAAVDLHRPYIDNIELICDKCGEKMNRIPEVIDCWVESASMPFAELHYPTENQELFEERYPADFVAEYIAQTRAWFYVMHVMGVLITGKAPFKNVVTTGTVLAEDGAKMSKSKNNFPDPWIVIEKYGMDAIRFYLLTSPVMSGDDLNFSEKVVSEISRKVSMLLYNVWTFYRMYTQDKIDDSLVPESSYILDRWILARLHEAQGMVTKDLDSYNTVRAGRAIVDFVDDLSTWYVRRSRDWIKQSDKAADTLKVYGYVLTETAKMLAPFMPFLADHLYKDLTGKESVHLEDWTPEIAHFDDELLKQMAVVREAASVGNAARKQLVMPVRQPLRALAIVVKPEVGVEFDQEMLEIVAGELNIKVEDASIVDKANLRPETIKTFPGTEYITAMYFDIELTPELKREGLARELERAVQDLRKKSGLKVGDLVNLYYNTQDEQLGQTLVELLDRKKTFVNQIETSLEVEADYETQTEVGKQPIWLGISKV